MQGKKHTAHKTQKSSQGHRNIHEPLPLIPDKRYFTISEAAFLCGVKPHVLRYWEQEFLPLKPIKRRGNRRYYQYKDVLMIRQIRELLYAKGFTIEGARAQLAESLRNNADLADETQGKEEILEQSQEVIGDKIVKKVIADLERVLQNLRSTEEVL
jgi:DNA-binding transcriptional MerR regulator